MSKGKKLSGYAENILTKIMGDNVPTKIDKSINNLNDDISTIISKYKSLDLDIPKNVRNKIQQKRNRVTELKKARKAKYYKDAEKANLQTSKNNADLRALKEELNNPTDVYQDEIMEQVFGPGRLRKELGRKKGGQLRGMGKALRGGGKVMRG
jgi:hypothetical protein